MNQANGNIEQIVGRILKRLVDASKKRAEPWLKKGREIMQYGYAPDHHFQYQKQLPNAFFKAKVSLTAEAFGVMGPYLFPSVPTRVVSPRPWVDDQGLRRAEIVGQLLNYTPKETKLRSQCRRIIVEGLGFGRGVAWTGRDPRTGLITSTYDTVRNYFIDPDAKTAEEAMFHVRRRVRARYKVLAELDPKDRWARQQVMECKSHESRPSDQGAEYPWEQGDSSADMICYYEVYLLTGLHNFKGGIELVKALGRPVGAKDAAQYELDNTPLKYLVTEDGRFITVSEWDVPYHEDGESPATALDFLENPDSELPEPPLAAGLGWQKAINWVVTMLMGKYRFTSRTFGALAKNGNAVSQKDKEKVRIGGDIELIEIIVNGGETKSLKDYIQQFDWDNGYLDSGITFLNMMEEKYQKATGLYEVLYAGETGRQMRSAQEAQMKERNSRSRIDDMKDQVAEFNSNLARKEALAWRFLADRKDVGKILGDQAAQDWGFLIRPEQIDVQQWAESYMQSGVPGPQAIEMAQQQLAQAVDIDTWRKEVDYSIEAASMRRRDVDTRIDANRELMNQAVPTQLQSVDPTERAIAYETMAEFFHDIGASEPLVRKYRGMAARLEQMGAMQQAAMAGQPAPIPGPGAAMPQEVMA